MSDHRTRYLLGGTESTVVTTSSPRWTNPERLEAELALARSLCEQAANAGHHALAASPVGDHSQVVGGHHRAESSPRRIARKGSRLSARKGNRRSRDQRDSKIAFPVGRMPWNNSPIRWTWPLKTPPTNRNKNPDCSPRRTPPMKLTPEQREGWQRIAKLLEELAEPTPSELLYEEVRRYAFARLANELDRRLSRRKAEGFGFAPISVREGSTSGATA